MTKINTLCVIDDDDVSQFMVRKAVEHSQRVAHLMFFHNGEEALHAIRDRQQQPDQLPDLIFLDINMPVMDGWEFLEEFGQFRAAIGKRIIIYMISSSVDERDVNRARHLSNVSGYIVKPITRDKFADILDELEHTGSGSFHFLD